MAKKKRGRPPTTGSGEQVKLRCHSDFLAAIDEWIARNGGKLTRPRAIMMLARLGLGAFAR
jgi:hypothetical protein